MRYLFLAVAISVARADAEIPASMLGTWTPVNHSTPHAILGPTPLLQTFGLTKDSATGDFWMSAIIGQVFRIRGSLMQYCFAHTATSPFDVITTESNRVVFCYQHGKRMRTHKENATGCDAAQIVLELKAGGTLELTFMMSPPVKHAWVQFYRTGDQPTVASYIKANRGDPCDPEHPGPPTDVARSSDALVPQLGSMCPIVTKMKEQLPLRDAVATATSANKEQVTCRQLDHGAWMLLPKEKIDIRFQHTNPMASCWPCNVSYSVSALIHEDQYIAIGFKGLAYRASILEERPNYFGMSTDAVDEERTSRAIVLGYASSIGSCIREMKAEYYVGTPTDVEENPHLFGTSVERLNGRTVIRFTIEQHAGRNATEMDMFFNAEMLSMRVMWAIGDIFVGGDRGCKAAIQMHVSRGMSPMAWFNENPKCLFDSGELGSDDISAGDEKHLQGEPTSQRNAAIVV